MDNWKEVQPQCRRYVTHTPHVALSGMSVKVGENIRDDGCVPNAVTVLSVKRNLRWKVCGSRSDLARCCLSVRGWWELDVPQNPVFCLNSLCMFMELFSSCSINSHLISCRENTGTLKKASREQFETEDETTLVPAWCVHTCAKQRRNQKERQ